MFIQCFNNPHPSQPLTATQSTYTSHKSQPQRRHRTNPHHRPPRPNNLLVRQLGARIPHQMSQPIESMVREWERHASLEEDFRHDGPGREGGCEGGALQVPPEQGGDEVGGAEDVDAPAEGGAGDTVEGTAVPGYLGAVD
jgi:hypothetical protein